MRELPVELSWAVNMADIYSKEELDQLASAQKASMSCFFDEHMKYWQAVLVECHLNITAQTSKMVEKSSFDKFHSALLCSGGQPSTEITLL
jgi:hypothetical protein